MLTSMPRAVNWLKQFTVMAASVFCFLLSAFCFLLGQGAGFEIWAEQGFDAVHGCLGEAPAVIVGLDLPGL